MEAQEEVKSQTIIEKIEFKPLFLAVCGLPFIYTGHHEWLVKNALERKIAGYFSLGLGRYGSSVSIARQRNQLITEGLKTDATHFVFVDWDLIPPEDAINRLGSHDKDVVSGVYYSKDDFSQPLIAKGPKSYQGKGLEKVDAPAIGFSLIKREVYENLKPPWFRTDPLHQTEEILFFQDCSRAKFELWTDFDLIAEHLGIFSNRDVKLKKNKEFINTL